MEMTSVKHASVPVDDVVSSGMFSPMVRSVHVFESGTVMVLAGLSESLQLAEVVEVDRTSRVPRMELVRRGMDTRTLRTYLNGMKPQPKLVHRGDAVLGLVQFSRGQYYLHVVTRSQRVGVVAGHVIYTVVQADLVPMLPEMSLAPSMIEDELRFLKLFESVDLSKDFYFSYTYDLTHTLQHNMCVALPLYSPDADPVARSVLFNERFTWNMRQALMFLKALPEHPHWVIPLVHGFFIQKSLQENDRSITVTLLCRRSRHFAGTRFNRRGLDHHGNVANEVESEILLCSGVSWNHPRQKCCSHVLYRGSIPLFWGHDLKQKRRGQPKPEIVITKQEPHLETTSQHFQRLFSTYGSPIVCINLIKRFENSKRESGLGSVFETAMEYLREREFAHGKLRYIAYDFLFSQKAKLDVTSDIVKLLTDQIAEIGYLLATETQVGQGKENPFMMRRQNGVVRVNCIDCLDRTNYAQYCIALCLLNHVAPFFNWVNDRTFTKEYPMFVETLKQCFMAHGDRISVQYAGSGAMHKHTYQSSPEKKSPEPEPPKNSIDQVQRSMLKNFGKLKQGLQNANAITAVKRYISNTVTDNGKQFAINAFLGNFEPKSVTRFWDAAPEDYFEPEIDANHPFFVTLQREAGAASTETKGTAVDAIGLDEPVEVKTELGDDFLGLAISENNNDLPQVHQETPEVVEDWF